MSWHIVVYLCLPLNECTCSFLLSWKLTRQIHLADLTLCFLSYKHSLIHVNDEYYTCTAISLCLIHTSEQRFDWTNHLACLPYTVITVFTMFMFEFDRLWPMRSYLPLTHGWPVNVNFALLMSIKRDILKTLSQRQLR